MAEFVLGQSVIKPDSREKALGRTQYGVDLKPRDALVAKVLRSPRPHARIVRVDTSRARQLPGVLDVVTGPDTLAMRYGNWIRDHTFMAHDRVRYVGEPVAAVAAVDDETAEEALELISVEYEELPAVFDPFEAMKPGAPLVHEDVANYACGHPEAHRQGNVLDRVRYAKGDVDKALAQADVVHRQSYNTPPVHAGITQPHEAVAAVDASGRLTLWTAHQSPFRLRQVLSQTLGLPMARVRVVCTAVGGSFGARATASFEPICCLLALRTRRPIALALTREEELQATFYREHAYITLELGARRDGTLLAVRGRLVFDTGAHHDLLATLGNAVASMAGPYRIPNFDLEGCVVYTNNTPKGFVRAPRIPSVIFAVESHLDTMAHKLGLDPVEIRLKNAVENGDTFAEGRVMQNVGFKKALTTFADHMKKQPPPGPNQAWGVAAGIWGLFATTTGGPPSAAVVKLNEDGTAVLLTGMSEMGGGQHAVMAQVVAEVLALPFEAVSVVGGDTDATPYEHGTGGSNTTYRVGTTVRLAAEAARRQLLQLAAQRLKVKEADLVLEQGKVYAREAPEISVPVATLAAAAISSTNGPIMGTSESGREGLIASMAPYIGSMDAPVFTANGALVEVDRETGKVKLLKYVTVQDVGHALNPKLVEAQVEGGVVFALGQALSEEIVTDRGRVLNANLLDYHQPTAADVPPIDMALIEVPSKFGPWGAKGVGEPPTVPVSAAIANAVFRAVGARVTELPLTPDKVVQALKQPQQ
ncbi:MAG: xanthine dehydrogenase family protein molybdopterin-binding subunit [Chloroflexi bacterium]|nr:xanthine dehydrogenase family protein molybdopterin-binding subunit [Chloroflexota bacterium]